MKSKNDTVNGPLPTGEPIIFTEDEWLGSLYDALGMSQTHADGAFTIHELRAITGRSTKTLYRGLRALKDTGRLEVVRVYRENLLGVMTPVPAYRLIGDSNDQGEH